MYYRTLMLTVIAKVMLKWKRVQFFLTHMYTLIVLVATHYVLYACQKAFCLSRGKYMKHLPADSSDFSSLSRFEQ